jgi:hypothetical protein
MLFGTRFVSLQITPPLQIAVTLGLVGTKKFYCLILLSHDRDGRSIRATYVLFLVFFAFKKQQNCKAKKKKIQIQIKKNKLKKLRRKIKKRKEKKKKI